MYRQKDCPRTKEALGVWGTMLGYMRAPQHEQWQQLHCIPGRAMLRWPFDDEAVPRAPGLVVQCESALTSLSVVKRYDWAYDS